MLYYFIHLLFLRYICYFTLARKTDSKRNAVEDRWTLLFCEPLSILIHFKSVKETCIICSKSDVYVPNYKLWNTSLIVKICRRLQVLECKPPTLLTTVYSLLSLHQIISHFMFTSFTICSLCGISVYSHIPRYVLWSYLFISLGCSITLYVHNLGLLICNCQHN